MFLMRKKNHGKVQQKPVEKKKIPAPIKANSPDETCIVALSNDIAKPVISAVTFIGDKAIKDSDVNTMFTQPYLMSQVTNLTNSIMMDHQKSIYLDTNCPEESKSKFMAWASYNDCSSIRSLSDQITSFIIQNCTDMIVATLVKFNSEALEIDKSNNPGVLWGVTNRMSPETIYDELCNFVPNYVYGLCSRIELYMDNARAYMEFNILMDSLLSHIVARIFNMYIIDIVATMGQNGEMENLYRSLFVKCYGADCQHLPNIADQYSFVTSIIRGMMEEYITSLRAALAMVAQSAANMVTQSAAVYARNFDNPEYSTVNMMNDLPELTSLFDDQAAVNRIVSGGKKEE